METLHPIAGFSSEPNLSRHGKPATPPYTPAKTKRRLERSDSPASIHPTETSSPARKFVKRAPTDTIKVEELVEGDVGYLTDIDVVYPQELEEIDDFTDHESEFEADAKSELGISVQLAQLRCDDEAEIQKKRRERRLSRRTGSRVFKRSHRQSVKSETEVTDSDALNDQDVKAGARRLRRRVHGPTDPAERETSHPPSSPAFDQSDMLDGADQHDIEHDQAADPGRERVGSDAMDVE